LECGLECGLEVRVGGAGWRCGLEVRVMVGVVSSRGGGGWWWDESSRLELHQAADREVLEE
jgi:hypothetical protein